MQTFSGRSHMDLQKHTKPQNVQDFASDDVVKEL